LTELSLHDPVAVAAALADEALVPPGPPRAPKGTTERLRASMARFSPPSTHGPRRREVVGTIDRLDLVQVEAVARDRAHRRLTGARVDALGQIAAIVPTETLAICLGATADRDRLVADVATIVRVIGRGAPADEQSDAAVERLGVVFADHPEGVTSALSILYQNTDATAALVATRLAAFLGGPAAPAVPRTRRVAARDTRVGPLVVPSGAELTLEIGVAGLPFGAGPHRCPGELVAERMVAGITAAIAAAGYVVDPASVTVDHDGRPATLDLVAADEL
jgi:hypothetical protein